MSALSCVVYRRIGLIHDFRANTHCVLVLWVLPVACTLVSFNGMVLGCGLSSWRCTGDDGCCEWLSPSVLCCVVFCVVLCLGVVIFCAFVFDVDEWGT